MKVAVLIKQVPDTETKIVLKKDASGIEDAGVKFVLSPYDEYAVEEALKIGGESTVIALGPDRCIDAIRTALAMGVQSAIHIDTAGQACDSYLTATALASVLKEGAFDIILCGKQAIDGDNNQVPQMIAELLQAPQVMVIEKLEITGDKARVTRRVGATKEIYESGFPLVLGADKGLNTPRYASLPGIMKAKSKPVTKKTVAELLNGATALVEFKNYTLPADRLAGKKIAGEPADQARELVKLLHEEAKVI